MTTAISIMITITRATATIETTAAIGKASADSEGSGVDVAVETGLMVSFMPTIEGKNTDKTFKYMLKIKIRLNIFIANMLHNAQ